MERLPVEVIGNILSGLGAARDIVIASATCRKWREAYRKHLHTLSFNSVDWPSYRDLTTSKLEILITQTIFQTKGLQGLSILMDDVDEFSASTVLAWLLYTRETLRQLCYNVRTNPSINILETCSKQKLEVIELAHNTISGVEPNFQRFPCLKSLSLCYVSVSALDLNLLLSACPKIELLELINPEIAVSDTTVELSSRTLKSIFVEAISLEKLILEADSLEILHLKDSSLEDFELIGKGTLKHVKIDDVSIIHLYIGDTIESLEVVDISNFTIFWPEFCDMISKSTMLRKLRLWDVLFDDENETVDLETSYACYPRLPHSCADLETLAVCFPKLHHLSLSYDLRDGSLLNSLQGSSCLPNVTVLELGWTVITDLFSDWVEGLLKRCPNLKVLVIHGVISDAKSQDECRSLANFTSSMVRLMRSHMHVEVKFEFE
uniref:F-box domain-containing protein n=1 Tax=Kalanchoe fedtschenkoi TaxID=63787 RepID=A0A7N1A0C3_KALFE